jgi:hypothetical protein
MGANLDHVYPQRKRCARCRSYFCWAVIAGLWCSRECARLPVVSADPLDWPREHYSVRDGVRREKRAFQSVAAGKKWAKRQGKDAYRCTYCWEVHIGSPMPGVDYLPHPLLPL